MSKENIPIHDWLFNIPNGILNTFNVKVNIEDGSIKVEPVKPKEK